ncbi:MAG: ECF transporter S component [Dehalococcoidales bacterium]|nr:ECF transporter S component [Dehalococcoidales bacterium]
MKPRYVFLAVISGLAVASFLAPVVSPSPLGILQNWGLMSIVLVALTIVAFFFEFETKATGSKEIALIGILGTVSAVVRIPFAAIPSVQPCTYLIICSGYVFGPLAGFMVGAITALVSNFFLGQGPWTIYQMFAWGLSGVSASYLRRLNPGRRGLIFFGVVWGYLFGIVMNLWFWAAFVYPLTPRTFLVSLLNSLWFDTAHAVANAIFLGLWGNKTISILERFRKRFQWQTSGPEKRAAALP